jgi:F420-dependent oxidoreductase-like protein
VTTPGPFADNAEHPLAGGLQLSAYGLLEPEPARLFESIAGVARAAEGAGYDALFAVDHLYGLPAFGPPEEPMLEAYTLLAALAASTSSIRLGALVTGVTYRHPGVLAKIVSSLDVLSRGRAIFSLGAAWYEAEHTGLGIEFPPTADRFDRLEEALEICTSMLAGKRTTFAGKHYRVDDAICEPRPLGGAVPVLIGGNGERRTFPLMVRFADVASLTSDRRELPRKVSVLRDLCTEMGRDPHSLWVTWHGTVFAGSSAAAAADRRDAYLAKRGLPRWDDLAPQRRERIGSRWLCGDEEALLEDLASLRRVGVDGFTCTVLADADDLEAFEVPGRAFAAAAAERVAT